MPEVPTLSDVARACGVSLATASKALNPHLDRCDVSEETRLRILEAARAIGWSRNRRRSAWIRKRWHNVGLLWGYRETPSAGAYEGIPEAVARALGEGFRLLIAPVPRAEDWREIQLSLRLDGALVLGRVDDEILAALEAWDYPAVVVNHRTERRLNQVNTDDLAGASALANHLADLGHRRIVYLHTPWQTVHYSESDRRTGVLQTAAARGMTVDEVRGTDFAAVVALCRAGASAVICYQCLDTPEVLSALRDAGLRVPHDVSVVSCQDLAWFKHLDPPITAARISMAEMAQDGTRLLLEQIAGKPQAEPLRQIMPETLVVRASTAPPPAPPRKRSRKTQ